MRVRYGDVLSLDLVQTVAFAGLVLFGGYGLKRLIPLLARYNIPAPVAGAPAGGRAARAGTRPRLAAADLRHRAAGAAAEHVLRLGRLRRQRARCSGAADRWSLMMMVLATVSRGTAERHRRLRRRSPLGQHPLMGVLAGSVTLTGGPATGLAFAPQFEQAGVAGAPSLAVVRGDDRHRRRRAARRTDRHVAARAPAAAASVAGPGAGGRWRASPRRRSPSRRRRRQPARTPRPTACSSTSS